MRNLSSKHFSVVFFVSLLAVLFSCKSGSINPFKAASPHEQYQRKLIASGLDKTGMGIAWIQAATQGLVSPLRVKVPYQELGYFAADHTPVTAYRFSLQEGQRLSISLDKKPAEQFMVYMDLWLQEPGKQPKLLSSADTLGNPVTVDIEDSGEYVLRLQPELLRSGSYTLKIMAGPSLEYPVGSLKRDHMQSFFGAGRDNNQRKHEGIDFMAARSTPVVAIARGTVVRVNENNLGGKVVWMRPAGKNYMLYYAHLDQQIAVEGQQVNFGDTLGLIGNTGNAKTTVPHLHFGIYGPSGAVDPFPFVNPKIITPSKPTVDLDVLGASMRLRKPASLLAGSDVSAAGASLKTSTVMQIDGASGSLYRVRLPDGSKGFISGAALSPVTKPLRKMRLASNQLQVFERADSLGAVKTWLTAGSMAEVLGVFDDYQLINSGEITGWIKNL